MDQACIYGNVPVLLTFSKDSDILVEPVFAASPIHLFFVDLAGKKDTIKILSDLNKAYLLNNKVANSLGPANEKIIRQAYTLLSDGDAEGVGRLMIEAQKLFDQTVMPHSSELTAPILHRLLEYNKIKPYIYGGKGVGSQGDGVAQFVARSVKERDIAMKIIEESFNEMKCFPLTIGAKA